MSTVRGYCEVCGKEYANIHQHRKTKTHAAKVREHEAKVREHETEPQNNDTNDSISGNGTAQETQELDTGSTIKKEELPELKEEQHATVRIVDEGTRNKKDSGLMDSLNEMLTPELKTALGGLIAAGVAILMNKVENIGKQDEESKNIVHDLHGQPYEW